eukprot:TRINITY_DN27461_c0_g1_i1.p1 TRINITY_DN27461_c0_g1~~TRINITY_DN27461_c0_g1_i1.p1  ORF type:complete len:241 (-),score=46.20 TRINITY_DN27461_c0_g1_i1:336-1058(-)
MADSAASFRSFGWSAAKRPRIGEVDDALPFCREADLDVEFFEETPAPSSLCRQLEDGRAKCRRLTNEGCYLAEVDRIGEALQRWEQALLFTESDAEQEGCILEQMAQGLMCLGRDFDAVRAAERAVERRPLWYCSHLTLGRALLSFGELERAIEALRRATELEPADQEAAVDLQDAERSLAEAKKRSETGGKRVICNGRVVESKFWETALRVTYDSHGHPTTHMDVDQEETNSPAEGIDP